MLQVHELSIGVDEKTIVENFNFNVQAGEMISIIGPNGSGKSTLLRGIAKMLPVQKGQCLLQGQDVRKWSQKKMSQVMCMLCQRNLAPHDMTVEELVAYGRYPHKKWYERLNQEDEDIVEWALEKTGLLTYRDRIVATLSGGESQRAWIAMALSQQPKVLLLDEPTTYLDIAHQHEVLELVQQLNETTKMTVIMVLHDLNQAAQFSDKVVVVEKGKQRYFNTPAATITEEMIADVYEMEAEIDYSNMRSPRIHLVGTVKSKGEMNYAKA